MEPERFSEPDRNKPPRGSGIRLYLLPVIFALITMLWFITDPLHSLKHRLGPYRHRRATARSICINNLKQLGLAAIY